MRYLIAALLCLSLASCDRREGNDDTATPTPTETPTETPAASPTPVASPTPETDADGDGWTVADGDCNDNDPSVYPGNLYPDISDGPDAQDTDCDGKAGEDIAMKGCKVVMAYEACNGPCEVDNDGDGYSEDQCDCNDADPAVYEGAKEIKSDGVDGDCQGDGDDW